MDDAAVVRGLVRGDVRVLFQHHDTQAVGGGEGVCGRQPDQTRADDGDVRRSRRHRGL